MGSGGVEARRGKSPMISKIEKAPGAGIKDKSI
jgi:hypothetical protein